MKDLCSGVGFQDIHGRTTRFFDNVISAEKLPAFSEGDIKRIK